MNNLIGLAQIEVIPGNPEHNLHNMLVWIERARDRGLKLLAFPEMAVPGYMIGDGWENDAFIRDCLDANQVLREASKDITVVWGNVDADFEARGEDGRTRKYNAAWIAHNGAWLGNGVLEGRTYKTLLPAYREFEDKRHFQPLDAWARENKLSLNQALQPFVVPFSDGSTSRVGLMLCEDMWDADYHLKPGKILESNNAELLINLSCSPWTWRKNSKRHQVAAELISGARVPLYYVNATGIQNNGKDIYALDGASTIYNADGSVAAICTPFCEDILTLEAGIAPGPVPVAATHRANAAADSDAGTLGGAAAPASNDQDSAEIFTTLVEVLRIWFRRNGNPPVAIGLSGGIDSALVATLLAIALGPDRVWTVNMPSTFNSVTTKNAAAQLGEHLGVHFGIIPIQDSTDFTIRQTEETVWSRRQQLVHLSLSSLNRENIQARDRGGRILAAVASAIGGVFTNNGNKTETAFGYATLYGDVNGALAPIGDLYKTQIYALARHINKLFAQGTLPHYGAHVRGEFSVVGTDTLIPQAILNVVPSAELSENQNVDQGKGDPILYEYHDRLLYQFIDGGYQNGYRPAYGRRDPYDILRWYLDGHIDTRLDLPQGTTGRYFSTLENFVHDLEEKWTWYQKSVFKRVQSPPIIALSKRAFGFDLRESVNGLYLSMQYRTLRDSVLRP